MKSILVRPYARYIARQVARDRKNIFADQQRIFRTLIHYGAKTSYGKDHGFSSIKSPKEFASQVPVKDYEALKPYFDRMVAGEPDIFWPGRPKYYAKTSGTTSGIKYIPLSRASMPNHINTARSALMTYAARGKNSRLFDGKVMFLSGSPILTDTAGVATGRLSGIVNHELPRLDQRKSTPFIYD